MRDQQHVRDEWADLMRRSQDGDQRAYAIVLKQLIPVIRASARRRVFDDTLVEDVVQDVLLTIHKLLHTYDPTRPLLPWVVAITSARAIDALRKQGRSGARVTTNGEKVDAIEIDRDASMLDVIGARHDVGRMLGLLPKRQRMVVEMVKLQELSLDETARISRLSVGAIKSLLHRAVARLKDYGVHHHDGS